MLLRETVKLRLFMFTVLPVRLGSCGHAVSGREEKDTGE